MSNEWDFLTDLKIGSHEVSSWLWVGEWTGVNDVTQGHHHKVGLVGGGGT